MSFTNWSSLGHSVGRMRSVPRLLWAAPIIVTLGVGGVLAGDEVTVSQQDRHFRPDVVQVPRGGAIRILNDDKVTHHVYVDSPGMQFDSGEQPIGASVELRFNALGTFDVQCAIHPQMLLRVTVE